MTHKNITLNVIGQHKYLKSEDLFEISRLILKGDVFQDKKNTKLPVTTSNYGDSEKDLIQYIKNASYDSFKRRGSHEVDRY